MEVQSPDPFGFIAPESLPVRRFFAKFMLAVPALMTLAVTVQSKGSADAGHVKPANAELNRRITAYVPLMKQMAKYRTLDDSLLSPEAARSCAKVWIRSYDEGKIKPLFLSEYSDSITSGVTGQIVQSNWTLARTLGQAAEAEAHRGAYGQAAKDALMSIQVSRILETTDSTTSSVANLRSRQACGLLRTLAPKLSQYEKKAVALELRRLKPNRQDFAAMLDDMYDLYRQDALSDPQEFRRGNGELPPRSVLTDVLQPLYDPSTSTHIVARDNSFVVLAKRSVINESETNRQYEKTLDLYSEGLTDPKG